MNIQSIIESLIVRIKNLKPSHGDIRLRLNKDFFIWKDGENVCLARYHDDDDAFPFHEEFNVEEEKENTKDFNFDTALYDWLVVMSHTYDFVFKK